MIFRNSCGSSSIAGSANSRRRITRIPDGVMQALQDHQWPGNVRELQNVIERAMIGSADGTLQLDGLLRAEQRRAARDRLRRLARRRAAISHRTSAARVWRADQRLGQRRRPARRASRTRCDSASRSSGSSALGARLHPVEDVPNDGPAWPEQLLRAPENPRTVQAADGAAADA